VAALLGTDEEKIGTETVSIPKRNNWLIASPVLALALIPLFGNYNAASRRGETDAADFARDMLNSVEPYGILVAVGDNDTFPLWYAQEVEGIRRDVLIANTSLMNTDWFVRQMIRRPIETYDAKAGPIAYRGKQWKKPTKPALDLTYDQADALPLYEQMTEAKQFVAGNIKAVVDPRNLPIAGTLQRADVLVYMLILNNPDRTVQFARSSGLYANELGFGNYLVMQGLTRKLARDSVVETPTIKSVRGEGFVDIETSRALWDEFAGPAALIKKNKWIDRPSIGIPFLYISSGMSLSDALIATGDSADASKLLGRVKGIATAVGLAEVLGREITRPVAPLPILADTAIRPSVPSKAPKKQVEKKN
jgi:hypothetical protein